MKGSLKTTSSAENSGLISASVLENDQLILQDGVLELGALSGLGNVDFLAITVDAHCGGLHALIFSAKAETVDVVDAFRFLDEFNLGALAGTPASSLSDLEPSAVKHFWGEGFLCNWDMLDG